MDGKEYTFNGWGEYTLVAIATETLNFTLQGRTGRADTDNGTLTSATVFVAFGVEESGVRVFVELDQAAKSCKLLCWLQWVCSWRRGGWWV